MSIVEGILVRCYEDTDLSFIESSFRALMRSSSLCREMSEDVFSASLPEMLDHVLEGEVLIAHGELDPGDVVGWLSSLDGILRSAFVKNAFRRSGIFTMLLEESSLPKSFGFSIRGPLSHVLEKKFPRAKYRPAFQTSGLLMVSKPI